MLVVAKGKQDLAARFVVGSLLLLPAVAAYGFACWYPALRTLGLSFQAAFLGRPGHFTGLANYAGLGRDPLLAPALAHSALVALARLLAILTLPALVGWLWRAQGAGVRLLGRLVLSLGLALSAPAALALLWRLAAGHAPGLHGLALDDEPRALLSYLLLEFLAFLGPGGALTAIALLLAGSHPGPAGHTGAQGELRHAPLGPGGGRPARTAPHVLLLAAIAAVASGLDAFSLPFVATGGGPGGQTLTLTLHLFRTAFQGLRVGQAAAAASPLLILSLGLGLAFGLFAQRIELRPAPARGRGEARRPVRGLLGGAALVLCSGPLLALYLWGAGKALLFQGGALARATSALEPALALLNGALVPGIAIALLQLPAAYLGALALTLIRPFGKGGSRWVFAALVASGFVPSVVVGIGLFDALRQGGLYDTPPAAGLPLAAGVASLVIFRAYFAGQAPLLEGARNAGLQPVAAFFRFSFRPSLGIAALAGAVALLVAGQSLLWPLLVLASSEYYPLSLQLAVHQASLAGEPVVLAAGAWLVATVWGGAMLLAWWPLQALVLGGYELVTSPPSPSQQRGASQPGPRGRAGLCRMLRR